MSCDTSVQQLDYKILHTRERKVYKKRSEENLKMDVLRTKAIESCSDVEDFYAAYSLEELTEEDEVHEYVRMD